MRKKFKTPVEFIRKGSVGIEGTYANADHHAKMLLPLIDYLVDKIDSWGFAKWRQGHNMHVLVTHDGRKFTLRPVHNDGYFGVKVSAFHSRGREVPLCTATAGDKTTWNTFSIFMGILGARHVFGSQEQHKSETAF